MPKKKPDAHRRFVLCELCGLGRDIVKAGYELTVETPVKALEETLSTGTRRK